MQFESSKVVSKQDRGRKKKVDPRNMAMHILQLRVHRRIRHLDVPDRGEGVSGIVSWEMSELRHENDSYFSS